MLGGHWEKDRKENSVAINKGNINCAIEKNGTAFLSFSPGMSTMLD